MKSIQNQYRDLQEGKMTQSNFMKNVRMSLPQYVTNVTSFKDTVKILKNKGILTEAKEEMPKGSNAKELYSEFAEADNLNQQEIITGITIEHELAPEKSYNEIAKLVIKNVKKEPNYYTNWKMSGVKGFEPKYMDNVNPDDYRMKFLTKDNLIDKPNVMKPVKGFADAKASANKAKKETNDVVKGVEEFGLTAKSTRGVKKMEPTGTKMKKIIMKEAESIGLKNTPDEQYLAKVINTYLAVKKAMNKINAGTELDGFEQEMLDHTYLKDFPKSQIIAAVNKVLNTQPGSTYTSQDIKNDNAKKNPEFASSKVANKVFSSPQQQALSKNANSLTKPGYGDESPEEFADMQKRAKTSLTKETLLQMVREIMDESGIDGGDNMIDDEQTSMY